MPSHGGEGDPHGLFDLLKRGGRRVGRGIRDTGRQLVGGARLLDRGMRHVGENPLDFLPGTGEARALGEGVAAFQAGRPGLGLLSLAAAAPVVGKGVKPVARAAKSLFDEFAPLAGTGFRAFARSEGPGLRTVASLTPSSRGGVKISLFDESAAHGASELPTNTLDFDSMDEALEAIRTRPALRGFDEVDLKRPEFSFERSTERAAAQRARESGGDAGLLRALIEGRQSPGGSGGFFNP